MSLIIHAFPLSPRSFKVLWAAEHLGLAYRMQLVNFATGDQAKPGYVALNPNGRAPVIEDGGFVLWESDAILEYLASLKPEAGLMPADTRARLQVAKWLYWDCAHWDPAMAIFAFERVVKKLFGRGEPDAKEIARGEQMLDRIGKVLDSALRAHRYVAGDTLTLGDIALAAPFCLGDAAGFPLESCRHILRWKAELMALPSWQKAAALRLPPG